MAVSESDKSRILSLLSLDTREKVKELKPGQLAAFFEIMKWGLLTPIGGSPAFILEGFAGTGKTFLVKVLADALPRVVLTATTNKAVKEVRRSAATKEAMTIYSLLGLRMEAKDDELILTPSPGGGKKVHNYRFVFLDEAGMTPLVLKPYLERALRMGVKFLLIGDRRQINPVGEQLSYIWDLYPTAKLKKVLRHDNQILALATHVRKTKLRNIDWKTDNANGEGVWCLGHDSFIRKLTLYAKRGYFDDGTTKAIAWRNNTVDELNHIIRYAIFGDKIYDSKFLVGDRIVFTSPYNISQYTQAYIDDEGLVESVQLGEHPLYGWKCYFLTVKLDVGTHIIRVLHEDSEDIYHADLNRLAQDARASGNKSDWYKFWQTKEAVAHIKYSHALTAHRAQGSTYKYVFVDVTDILSNSNRSECRKCVYTALTRPTTRLYLK